MARKSKSKKQAKDTSKVSQQAEEVWDLVHVIPKHEVRSCRVDGCKHPAVATWASNLEPEDQWDMCEECQLTDFGGWPEGVEPDNHETENEKNLEENASEIKKNSDKESPEKPVTNGNNDLLSSHQAEDEMSDATPSAVDECSRDDLSNSASTAEGREDPSDSTSTGGDTASSRKNAATTDTEAEMWDIKKILSLQDITKEATIKCSHEGCPLPACSIWSSNLAPTTKWYSCLDCQENDFDGWPPVGELPIKSMTQEHLDAIAQKCSRQKKPAMPEFSLATSPSTKQESSANFVTPLNSLGASQEREGFDEGNCAKITPLIPKQGKPSASALAMHKKWQDAAEAMGGKDARIVVSKAAAKKLIFALMSDSFRPMNITQIYKVRCPRFFE